MRETDTERASASFPEPEKPRWQLLRAGLQNIWEYDDQRFLFHRGKLLLRGRNESGKTKALEVLLPFLLDADLSPQRLDPFGSTSRPMRWNLLNEGNPQEKIHVGYVWLELGRVDEGGERLTCTIGAGLRAKRSTNIVDAWYFLTDQRVDRDLSLIDEKRAPLLRNRLEALIGDHGQLFDRKADYRRAVNQKLFGMAEEQYSALIEAMIQLRRPQLSKRLQPSELSQMLTASLPPLDISVVAPLSEGFERLDRHRSEQEELVRTEGAIRSFLRVYRRYVAIAARGRAQEVIQARVDLEQTLGALEARRVEHREAQAQKAERAERVLALERELEGQEERLTTLRTSEAFRAIQELDAAERLARSFEEQALGASRRLARARARLEEGEVGCGRSREGLKELDEALRRVEERARPRALSAALKSEHEVFSDQLASGALEAARGTLESLLEERNSLFGTIADEAERSKAAAAEAQHATARLRDAERAADEAREALEGAERQGLEAQETFLRRVSRWSSSLSALSLDSGERAKLLSLPVDEMGDFLGQRASPQVALLDEQASELTIALRDLERTQETLRDEQIELEEREHRAPGAPAWRSARPEGLPGAPLYLLCDFTVDDAREQAALEAALEASGLLDAWVTPEGALFGPSTLDAFLVASPPLKGPTLADVLRPTPTAGVEGSVVEAVLRSVALSLGGEPPRGEPSWVSLDGRFRLGPIEGRADKAAPVFLGVTAREAARAGRLEAVLESLESVEDRRAEVEGGLAEVRGRRQQIREELERFPSLAPLFDARAEIGAASRGEEARRRAVIEATEREALAQAELLSRGAVEAGAATRLGLRGWSGSLETLREQTLRYEQLAFDMLREAQKRHDLQTSLLRVEASRVRAEGLLEEARLESDEAQKASRRAMARLEALRGSAGVGREELQATLQETERRRGALRAELDEARRGQSELDQLVGASGGALAAEAAAAAEARGRHHDRAERFRAFAAAGLLEGLDLEGFSDPEGLSTMELGEIADRVDLSTGQLDASTEALDRAENRLAERHQELLRGLSRKDLRVVPQRLQGVLVYEVDLPGRRCRLSELSAELTAELAARGQLLGEQERLLFETFLSGETHEHLRTRLREAHRLVSGMNELLEKRPTASGMKLRLRWGVSDEAPGGTAEAIELLLKSGHLLSREDRDALRDFLRQRLDAARAHDGQGTIQERMFAILDYRHWFVFTVEFRTEGSPWRRLTRKAHGAGSGGQKAVMLHLPLFAAAAAFFESAEPTSPRLIVLDEAFAGIDRDTRGQLMGLLGEFDLDFVMTSYDEWGFFEQLDGLSTYHLSRQRGVRGVYADRFLWDGHRALELGAA